MTRELTNFVKKSCRF